MNILGFVILIVGIVGLVMSGTGLGIEFLPEQVQMPLPWIITAGVGAVIYFFTRRPKN